MRPVSTTRLLYTGAVLAGSIALLGCPKRPEVAQAGPATIGPPAATAPATAGAGTTPKTAEVPVTRSAPPVEETAKPAIGTPSGLGAEPPLKDIFFNFDDATIRSDQQRLLDADFAWLKAHPKAKVMIQGNCDERGTEEYNLALGERRAQAVKDSLVAEGITADRITTISYGKDRPFAMGHDENAWRLNRRDHFASAQ